MVDAGTLDRKIIIEYATITQDEFGQEVETWSERVSCWAAVVEVSSIERFKSSHDLSTRTAKFYIRHYSALDIEDRIDYDSKYWNITGIAAMQKHTMLEITAEVKE